MSSLEEIYIIDGYNLLLRAFQHLAGTDLQSARERLEVRLREFQRALGTGTRLVLIYDGAQEIGAAFAPRRAEPEFEVVFSAPPRTADDEIIAECRRLEGTAPLTVVSSDLKDIASKVRGLRLRHRTSEDFAEMIDETMRRPRWIRSAGAAEGSSAPPEFEKPSPEEVSPADVEEWLKIFSQPKSPRDKPTEGASGKA